MNFVIIFRTPSSYANLSYIILIAIILSYRYLVSFDTQYLQCFSLLLYCCFHNYFFNKSQPIVAAIISQESFPFSEARKYLRKPTLAQTDHADIRVYYPNIITSLQYLLSNLCNRLLNNKIQQMYNSIVYVKLNVCKLQ